LYQTSKKRSACYCLYKLFCYMCAYFSQFYTMGWWKLLHLHCPFPNAFRTGAAILSPSVFTLNDVTFFHVHLISYIMLPLILYIYIYIHIPPSLSISNLALKMETVFSPKRWHRQTSLYGNKPHIALAAADCAKASNLSSSLLLRVHNFSFLPFRSLHFFFTCGL
jgi:hypothetical protein